MSGLTANSAEARARAILGTDTARSERCSGSGARECPVDAVEAAKFLKMTRSTVLALARKGVIPAHPVGVGLRKRWLFFLSELEAYVRSTGVHCVSHPCALGGNF